MGLGVTGIFVNVSKDIVPNKFYVKAGAATAISNTALSGGGTMIGTELNAEAQYTYKVFLTFSLSAGYLFLGDFYDSPLATSSHVRPSKDPWVCFATMSWLMF